ncbi:MAG: hypothetical protein ACE5D7_01020 [Fidelibacterota bacterium]
MSKIKMFKSGMSLIEIIIGIIFLGVAFVGTLYAIRSIQSEAYLMEALIRGTSFGNSIMEVIRSHRFDENLIAPWSNPLGPEEALAADYDDVDDYYGGFDWTYPEYGGYTAKSRVFYIDPAVSLDDSIGTPMSYKKILVHIYHDAYNQKLTIESQITP